MRGLGEEDVGTAASACFYIGTHGSGRVVFFVFFANFCSAICFVEGGGGGAHSVEAHGCTLLFVGPLALPYTRKLSSRVGSFVGMPLDAYHDTVE